MKIFLMLMVGIMFALIPMANASTEILDIETSVADDVMSIKTSIENTEQQNVFISIYVESDDQVPLGVMFFKTTLVEGKIPIEFGFTLQEGHTPEYAYMNIFTDIIENGGIHIDDFKTKINSEEIEI
jgi:hypothetical protein